jgi:hypothetical protein
MLKNYKELKVWQKAYRLCLDIYQYSRSFPDGKLENLIKTASEVERMLKALIRSLQNKSPR